MIFRDRDGFWNIRYRYSYFDGKGPDPVEKSVTGYEVKSRHLDAAKALWDTWIQSVQGASEQEPEAMEKLVVRASVWPNGTGNVDDVMKFLAGLEQAEVTYSGELMGGPTAEA